MRVNLQSTDKIATIEIDGRQVPARVWAGKTENGVECFAYITRILCHKENDNAEFERDLQEHSPGPASINAIPLHLIL